jgi:outer membrane protein OmpA-like peptidoglycan-associated protein
MKQSRQYIAAVLIALFALPTYTFAADPATTRDKTKRGAIIGAVAGGVLGAVIGNNRGSGDQKKGAIVGAVAGTAIGAGIGAYMDKQERELRQIEGVEVQRTADDELNVIVRNEILFDFNSSALRSASRSSLREMADVFERYNDTTIAVEGHTDSVGSNSYNLGLSRRRANSVANYLESLGVDGYRVETEAYGESQPRASNSSASGRQQNRRVEIRVKADRS